MGPLNPERPRRQWRLARWVVILTLGSAVVCPPAAAAAPPGDEVPAELQLMLLTRILTFDRNLVSRAGDELVVGIVHQSGYPESRDFVRELRSAWNGAASRTIADLPVRIVFIDLKRTDELSSALVAHEVDIAWLGPLRAVDPAQVLAAVRRASAAPVAALAEWVDRGAAVGFGLRDGKPLIRVHLAAARACALDFDAALLRLAEIVG